MKKRDMFIGWMTLDGLLTVDSFIGRIGRENYYKVICSICSNDRELFPLGYFQITRSHLLAGNRPCGCSPARRWALDEYIVRINRLPGLTYSILGPSTPFKNNTTKLNCFCNVCLSTFICRISNLLNGTSCPDCAKYETFHYGFYPRHVDRQDFLYVLNFNDEYIKIGRSFNVPVRLRGLKHESKCSNIKVLSLYTGSHVDVFNVEQNIHKVLHSLGYIHLGSLWSNETFVNESLGRVYELLHDSSLSVCDENL